MTCRSQRKLQHEYIFVKIDAGTTEHRLTFSTFWQQLAKLLQNFGRSARRSDADRFLILVTKTQYRASWGFIFWPHRFNKSRTPRRNWDFGIYRYAFFDDHHFSIIYSRTRRGRVSVLRRSSGSLYPHFAAGLQSSLPHGWFSNCLLIARISHSPFGTVFAQFWFAFWFFSNLLFIKINQNHMMPVQPALQLAFFAILTKMAVRKMIKTRVRKCMVAICWGDLDGTDRSGACCRRKS